MEYTVNEFLLFIVLLLNKLCDAYVIVFTCFSFNYQFLHATFDDVLKWVITVYLKNMSVLQLLLYKYKLFLNMWKQNCQVCAFYNAL